MKKEEYLTAIEAILFVSNRPVKLSHLSDSLAIDIETTESLLNTLEEALKERGFVLQVSRDSYLLAPNEKYRRYYEKFIRKKRQTLSKELLEVIAILAKGNQNKEYIDKLRGVNSARSINSLMKKGYISRNLNEGRVSYSLTESCIKLINPEVKKIIKNTDLFNIQK
jgi:segregation and condensation protein B